MATKKRRRKKKPVKRYPPEDAELMLFGEWLDMEGFLWCHVPNELMSKLSLAQKKIEKRKGLKAGVPDVLIFSGRKGAPLPAGLKGIAVELKRRGHGNVASTAQKRWLAALRAGGWEAAVCKGAVLASKFVAEVFQVRSGVGKVAKA